MENNQSTISDSSHLPVINSMRGIAAIMIMVHHMTVYLLPQINQYVYPFTPFFRKNYLWVDFFFILSGFVACHVYKEVFVDNISRVSFARFIISRFARLYPLHFIILILFVVVEFGYLYYFQGDHLAVKYNQLPLPFDNEFSEKTLLLNIMMLNALPRWGTWNGPSWAMSAIWITMFALPFIIKMSFKIKMIDHLVLILVCYIVLWVLLEKSKTLDIMAVGGMIRCLSETVIGIGCYHLYCVTPANRFLKSDYLLSLCLLLVFASMMLQVNHVLTICIFFPLILFAAYQGHDSVFSNRYLLLLGDLSFSIYIIHWLPFYVLDKIALVATGSKFRSVGSPVIVVLALSFSVMLIMGSSYWAYIKIETPLRIKVKNSLMRMLK